MIKELKYFFFIIVSILFIFFTIKYYFSESNYKKSYRSISNIDNKISKIEKDLVLLKSDTDEIIEYVETNNMKKKKYSFWELLYND
tara:strand:+ start:364 stop:621 length:258 start_codon:yes stop_codon:yes gene_type:complete